MDVQGGAGPLVDRRVAEHIAVSETTILQLVTDKILKAPSIPRDRMDYPTTNCSQRYRIAPAGSRRRKC